MAEAVQTIRIKQSSATTTPASLLFAEPAFTDVGGVKRFFIGDGTGSVYQIQLSDWAAPTSDIDLGSNRLTNVAQATADNDAVTYAQVQTLVNGLKWRSPVEVYMTTNVNISNPGTTVFDGITLNLEDRILLGGQTTTGQNGLYVFKGSGVAMERAEDADSLVKIDTTAVLVDKGTNKNNAYVLQVDNTGGTLNTEAIEVVAFKTDTQDPILTSIANLTIAAGDILVADGVDSYTTFTLSNSALLAKDNTGAFTSVTGTLGQILTINASGDWEPTDTLNGGSF